MPDIKAVVAGILLLALGACGPDSESAALFACPECAVVVTVDATLGALTDPAGPVGLNRVATGPGGDIILTSDMAMGALPLRYSASGEFKGEFGARGEGPGEFGSVTRLTSVPDGPLVLFDAQLGVHLFDADGAFVRRLNPVPPIPHPLREPAILDGGVLAVAAVTRSTRSLGRPVELFGLADGAFVGAVGPPSPVDAGTGVDQVPHIAPACGGGVWLYGPAATYSRWSVDGAETAAFGIDSVTVARAAAAVGLTPGELATLRLHDDCATGVRWIAIVLHDSDDDADDVAPGAPLSPALLSPSHIHEIHNTLVLAVAAETDAILAAGALPLAVNHFLPDGRLAVDMEEASGHQYVQLLRPTLQR